MEKEVKIEPKIEETKEYLTEMVPSMYMLTEKPYVQVLLDKLCQYNSCDYGQNTTYFTVKSMRYSCGDGAAK